MLSINTFFTEMDVSFQNVNHALISVIVLDLSIQSCSKVVPKAKSCSRLLKSKKVAQNAKVAQKLPSTICSGLVTSHIQNEILKQKNFTGSGLEGPPKLLKAFFLEINIMSKL